MMKNEVLVGLLCERLYTDCAVLLLCVVTCDWISRGSGGSGGQMTVQLKYDW